jgi:hypothetical protein
MPRGGNCSGPGRGEGIKWKVYDGPCGWSPGGNAHRRDLRPGGVPRGCPARPASNTEFAAMPAGMLDERKARAARLKGRPARFAINGEHRAIPNGNGNNQGRC